MLADTERRMVEALVAGLEPPIRSIVESQFEEYNLVQREVDGRALNFYRVRLFARAPLSVSNSLDMATPQAPLIKLEVAVGEDEKPLHAVLWAVNGRAFSVSFDRRPVRTVSAEPFRIITSRQSWRSSVRVGSSAT